MESEPTSSLPPNFLCMCKFGNSSLNALQLAGSHVLCVCIQGLPPMFPRSPNLRSSTKDVSQGQGLLTSITEPQLLDFIFQFIPVTVALSLCSGTRPNPGTLSSFLHQFQAIQVNGVSLWASRRHRESLGPHIQ